MVLLKQGTEEQVDNKDANFGTAAELTLLKNRRKIDVLPAPADPSTIALSRIGAPLPFLAP